MVIQVGVGAWVGIGEEPTYGTEAVRTRFFPLRAVGDALAYEFEQIESEDIDTVALDNTKLFQGQEKAGGSLEFEMTYEGMLIFFKHAFGHDVTPTGAGPFVYAFNPPGTPDVVGEGLTIEVSKGNTSTKSFLFTGCKITKLTISGGENSIMLINLEFLCQQGDLDASPSTPTSTQIAGDPSKMAMPSGQTEATLTAGGTDKKIKSFTFTYDNKYEADFDVASKTMNEPFRSAKTEAMFECEMRMEDFAEFEAYKAFTNQVLLITFRRGAGTDQMVLTTSFSKLVSGATPFTNTLGVIYFSPTYKLLGDAAGGNSEFIFTVTNDEAVIS